jgi:hypothetical protein
MERGREGERDGEREKRERRERERGREERDEDSIWIGEADRGGHKVSQSILMQVSQSILMQVSQSILIAEILCGRKKDSGGTL